MPRMGCNSIAVFFAVGVCLLSGDVVRAQDVISDPPISAVNQPAIAISASDSGQPGMSVRLSDTDTNTETSKLSGSELYQAAISDYKNQRWSDAADRFRSLSTDPGFSNQLHSQFYYAVCLIQLGRDAEAATTLDDWLARTETIRRQTPSDNKISPTMISQGWLSRGVLYQNRSQHVEARTALEKAVKIAEDSKQSSDAFLRLAWLDLQAGEPLAAAQRFSAVLTAPASENSRRQATLGLAVIQYQKPDYPASLQLINDLLVSEIPDDFTYRAKCLKAKILRDRGEINAAMIELESLLDQIQQSALSQSMSPSTTMQHTVLLELGRLAESKNDTQAAVRYYQAIFDNENQTSREIWLEAIAAAAKIAMREKNYTAANTWLMRAIPQAIQPAQLLTFQLQLSQVCSAVGEYQQCVDTLESVDIESLALAEQEFALFHLSEAYFQLNQYAKAEPLWQRLLQLSNGQASSEMIADQTNPSPGTTTLISDKIRDIDSYLGQSTKDWIPVVMLRQAQAAVIQNQWSQARTIAQKLQASYPNFVRSYEVEMLLGRCDIAEANFDLAITRLNNVVQAANQTSQPTAVQAQWLIAEIHLLQRKYDVAITHYQQVQQMTDDSQWHAASATQIEKCQAMQKQGQNPFAATNSSPKE